MACDGGCCWWWCAGVVVQELLESKTKTLCGSWDAETAGETTSITSAPAASSSSTCGWPLSLAWRGGCVVGCLTGGGASGLPCVLVVQAARTCAPSGARTPSSPSRWVRGSWWLVAGRLSLSTGARPWTTTTTCRVHTWP